ncbi:hypothetical protein BH10CHL1_BH10CHL1_31830 [soil metagenome]
MNLKLKRLVRTSSSEQYALFDLAQIDQQQQPMTIGKLDLHYTAEGVYGTLLLWDEASRQLTFSQRQAFIRGLLDEVVQPMGVPNEYVIEFFNPQLDNYEVFHNVAIDDDELDDEPLKERTSTATGAPKTDASAKIGSNVTPPAKVR